MEMIETEKAEGVNYEGTIFLLVSGDGNDLIFLSSVG